MSALEVTSDASEHERPDGLIRKGLVRSGRVAERLLAVALAIGVWQLVTVRIGSFFFPPPSEIVIELWENWFSGPATSLFLTPEFGRDVVPSMVRVLGGWGIAAAVGVAVGLVLGLSDHLEEYVSPIVDFLRSAPGPALLPIFLLLFGIGWRMKVAFIAFGSIWPILLNTVHGVRSVDPVQVETARAFRITGPSRLFRIILPSAAPSILAGMRIATSIALVLMVISDMLASSGGFGFFLVTSQREFKILDVWAAIALLGLIGWGLNALFHALERRMLGWHAGARQRSGAR